MSARDLTGVCTACYNAYTTAAFESTNHMRKSTPVVYTARALISVDIGRFKDFCCRSGEVNLGFLNLKYLQYPSCDAQDEKYAAVRYDAHLEINPSIPEVGGPCPDDGHAVLGHCAGLVGGEESDCPEGINGMEIFHEHL